MHSKALQRYSLFFLFTMMLLSFGCSGGLIQSPEDGGSDAGTTPCVADEDCDDGNICTDDSCSADKVCEHKNNVLACDDQDLCTQDDTCTEGVCSGTAITCDDGNPCTDDTCDPESGCVSVNNTSPCDDGNACTSGDVCSNGGCQPGSATDCDDDNPCTDDSCDSDLGCVHQNNTRDCDDNSLCTDNDVCKDGVCSGTAISCDDQNPCTDDSCDPNSGCVFTNNSASCNDGDACTQEDVCANGTCSGTALVCDDNSDCTTDSCDSASGCVFTNVCDANASCTDSSCQCNAGFSGDGLSCTDIDECSDGTAQCDNNATCSNTPGAYACLCNVGYSGDGQTCTDIDECTQGTDQCDENATCTNTDGDYTCSCNEGFTGDGFTCTPEVQCPNGICQDGEDYTNCPQDCDFDVVVIVEDSLSSGLSSSLDTYKADLASVGYKARVLTWSGGTVDDLKALIFNQVDSYGVEGALLIGNLPAAWYEQTAFDTFEQFPLDLYLEDRSASWTDSNSNGKFDSHSQLDLEIFVSRLKGTSSQLVDYFTKNHDYRTNGSLVDVSAFVFMDDDWQPWAGTYGLEAIYNTVDLISDLSATTRAAYINKMTTGGAEFVYQWIHSSPTTLYVSGTGGGQISTFNIASNNFQGSFYNMFDCSACRFTQTNLGMTYLMSTDYGLATIGSTKTGGIYAPGTFHSSLASGHTWGESFRLWYNATGRWDDEWYLGIIIMGDPLLTIQGDTRGLILQQSPAPLTKEQLHALWQTMKRDAQDNEGKLGTFESYREANPEFFSH